MKRSVGLWQLWGFAVTSFGGTILHFLYEWTNESRIVAPFSGVNESTWEHMKLLFWPMLAFAIVQSCFFRDRKDFWCIKSRGTLVGLGSIPLLFYTYNGMIGRSPDWINIAIFFISAAVAYRYEARLLNKPVLQCQRAIVPSAFFFAMALLFIVFTFAAPSINLFKDPLTGTYGI